MLIPAVPDDEASRLRALRALELLDTPPEPRFDRLTRLAKQALDVPIALVSLIDADRQWFKSRQGLDVCETARDVSFCGHAILGADLFEISDAREDPRFADNPLVTGPPHIRMYAGVPLASAEGHRVGTLCVISDQPRVLTVRERAILRDLADCVAAEIQQCDLRVTLGQLISADRLQTPRNQSEQILRGLFELSPIGIALNDFATGTFVDLNESLLRPTGYTREEFVKLSYWDVTPREYEAAEKLQLESLRKTGRYGPYEKEYIRKDGSRYPILLNGMLVRDPDGRELIWSMIEDISERKQAEQALATQARHTKTIIDNMIDGIITIDAKGVIQSFNPAAERIFAYSHEEVLGRNVSMLMPNPHREAHDSYLRNYQRTGVARIIGIGREVEGRRKDGSLFPMELAVSEISRKGEPLYVGMARDISERKRIERMKSEFVSTVSHELRTPLTSISGALGLIEAGALGALPDAVQQMVEVAHKNSLRLTHLINDLLDMEKIAAGKLRFEMKAQALMPVVEQALESYRTYGAERDVKLVLKGRAGAVWVWVDGERLIQVLANLLSNAIKFSPEGGTVEVDVAANEDNVRVVVIDHGPGVPEAFRSRIFEKFSQADASDTRQNSGTGLGLAISRELIQRMGGAIGFDSSEGRGAAFWIELPLYENEAYLS